MMKLSDIKIAVISDTILYIWNNYTRLSLEDVDKLIDELIKVIQKEDNPNGAT